MFFLLLLSVPALLNAENWVEKGFDHFYNLEFDQSIIAFREAVRQQPGKPDLHNHLAQAILYREMLRTGSLESELVTGNNPFVRREKMKLDPEDQREFSTAVDKALQLSEAVLAKSPDDIPALYAKGVALGFRANYNFLVRKAWMDALKDVTASRKAHNRITDLKPDMVDARVVQGVHDYVVGSLPFSYRMLGFVAGFHGDRAGGIRTLELVAKKGNLNKNDAKVMLAAVYRRERKPVAAIPLLKELLQLYPRNYLFLLEMVQMYADDGNLPKALDALKELDRRKLAGTPGFAALPVERINYGRGNLLFWYRDYDTAIGQLQKATAAAKSLDPNTGSMSWLRLGQCYDMKQQRDPAIAAYRSAIDVAPDSDAARQANKYVRSPYRRGKE